MKKIIALLLVVVLIFSLSACGQNNDSSSSAPSSTPSENITSSPGIPYSPEVDPQNDPFDKVVGNKVDSLPFRGSKKFTVKPSTGIWFSTITINPDGSFEGAYRETASDVDEEYYPNGHILLCDFHGNFSEFKQVDQFTYAIKLDTLYAELAPEESWLDSGYYYETVSPLCVEGGYVFYLYLPGKPTSELTDAELNWFFGNVPTTLDTFAITNSYVADAGYNATYTFFAD